MLGTYSPDSNLRVDPFPGAQLQAKGFGTWRGGLNLDAAADKLEVDVSISRDAGKLSVGYKWGRYNDGGDVESRPLDLFAADETVPMDFPDGRDLPDAFKKRMMQWIRQQAGQLLEKESKR